jgi:hypothetical protein
MAAVVDDVENEVLEKMPGKRPNFYCVNELSNVIQTAGLTVRSLPGSGEGIVATRLIGEGGVLIEVPLDHTVLMAKTPRALASVLLSDSNKVTNDFFERLGLTGDGPGCFSMPASQGVGPSIFDGSLLMLLARRRAREADLLSKDTGKDVRMCQNALYTVFSRCLFLKGEYKCFVLPPFVEYLNHDPECNAKWSVENSSLVVRSCRDIQPGEQVTISYGEHSNEVFAIQYFFIPDSNPKDVLYLPMRRELTVMRVAKYEGTSITETNSNFIPYGFVEYGEKALEVAKVVHPEDPDHFIHWKLRQLREKLEKSMITLMKSKRKNKGLSDANIVWLKYLQRKVAMVNEYIKKYSLKGKKGDSVE